MNIKHALKPRKYPTSAWLPARMKLRIEFGFKISTILFNLDLSFDVLERIFEFLKNYSFWPIVSGLSSNLELWYTLAKINALEEYSEDEGRCWRRIRRTRMARTTQEDAVNDFGVAEKSKYSTATKPVLLK